MTTISKEEFQNLTANGRAIGQKGGYPAVVLHPDKTVTKLWIKRSRIGHIVPSLTYAARFIRAASKLKTAGIAVPEILSFQEIEGTKVQVVRYTEIAGTSIRELLEQDPNSVNVEKIAAFFLHLHEKGILFRAIHFGNIIAQPDGTFGLIDFSNVTFKKRPANLMERAKNLATPLRYRDDLANYEKAGLPDLVITYLKNTELDEARFGAIIEERLSKK